MILVTGASGSVGGPVVGELLGKGIPVRAMYRSTRDAAKAPVGAETAIADFGDRASLDAALDGVDAVYLVCSPIPQLVELEIDMLEACCAHGIGRLVLNSAFGAGQYERSFPSWHYQVEQRVHAAGIPFTILRPESFMQNIVNYYGPTIRAEGAFYAAGGSAPLALVDVRDIAAAAAVVLTTEGHAGTTYTLTGGEALSYAEVAARISELLGAPVRYVDLPPAAIAKSMTELGMPPWQVEALVELQAFYTDGPGTTVTTDVETLLGRPPILFDQFLKDHAASFTRQAATTTM